MSVNKKTVVSKDFATKKIKVTREFDAPPEQVWKAWTESELLDQWWAPRPWKAETKNMDFRVGGNWLYCMSGPDGSKNWCRVDFKAIDQGKSFSADNYFCDENGVEDRSFPVGHWKNVFSETDGGTKVDVELSFDDEAGMKKLVDMGFEGGFTMAHGNLDELLAQQKA